jgi:hypothetical protein
VTFDVASVVATNAVVVVGSNVEAVVMAAGVVVAVAKVVGTAVALLADGPPEAAAPLWYTFKELIVQ